MADFEDSLLDSGTILLCGRIDEKMYADFFKQLIYLEKQDDIKEIEIVINSEGGSLASSLAICSLIEGSRKKTKTITMGMAYSGGFTILISGKERIATDNSTLLAHQYFGGQEGKYGDLVATRRHFDVLHENMVVHYTRHSKLSEKEIRNKILKDTDTFLTPKEALKYGFIDKIVGEKK